MTTEGICWICEGEGTNGEKPCPNCNPVAWNAYHEAHTETITIVEHAECRHPKTAVTGTLTRADTGATLLYDGLQCEPCRSITWLRWLPQTAAETVE